MTAQETKFHEKPTTKLGDIGEQIVLNKLEALGYASYIPHSPGSHPFDILVAKNYTSLSIVEVKTRTKYRLFDSYSINEHKIKTYTEISKKYHIPFWIIFVDYEEGALLYAKLSELMVPTMINGTKYPLNLGNGLISFPIKKLHSAWHLTEDEQKLFREYFSRLN